MVDNYTGIIASCQVFQENIFVIGYIGMAKSSRSSNSRNVANTANAASRPRGAGNTTTTKSTGRRASQYSNGRAGNRRSRQAGQQSRADRQVVTGRSIRGTGTASTGTSFYDDISAFAYRVLPKSVPPPAAGIVVLGWALLGLLWWGGAITSWAFTLFLATLLPACVATAVIAANVARGKTPFRAARASVLLTMLLIVPLIFDPHSTHVFNLPKYTVIVWGALVLGGLWVIETVAYRRPPRWTNGMHWLIIASAIWVLITAITSVDTGMSVLGAPGSYDGLYSALAFMVIAFSAAEAFDSGDLLKVMGVLGFAACSVASIYGLVQIHDLITHGPHWDFVHWAKLPFHNVFSTMGNPNFLSALYVIVLPACILIILRATNRWAKAAGAIACLILLAEILQSATRGAWVAAVASAVVMAIVLWPEIKRHPILITGSTAIVVVLAGGGLILGGAKYIGAKLTALTNAGPASSIQQRFDLWTASLHIGSIHPFLGTGPDTFEIVYPRYESAQWAHYLGQIFVANGAHDVFMNTLADKGWIGVAILVAILLYAGVRAVGTLVRQRSAGMNQDRYVLGVLAAGFVAYVVQDIFNVQEVALSMVFWLLLGMLCVVANEAIVREGASGASGGAERTTSTADDSPSTSVPDSSRATSTAGRSPSASSRTPSYGTSTPSSGRPYSRRQSGGLRAWLNAEVGTPASPNRGRGGGALGSTGGTNKYRGTGGTNRYRNSSPVATWITAIVVAVLVVILAYGADGPWRAAHDYWAALIAQKQYPAVVKTYGQKSTEAVDLANAYFTDLNNASTLNPWEASYPAAAGINFGEAAVHSKSSSTQIGDLAKAHTYLQKAVSISPLESKYRDEFAQVLVDQAKIDKARGESALATKDLHQAVSQLEKAVYYDPRDQAFRKFLSQTVAQLHPAAKSAGIRSTTSKATG